MNIQNSLSSLTLALNEQIARQLFEVLPDRDIIMVMTDKDGNCWPSDSEEFARMNIDEEFLRQLYIKVDDGDEPIITQSGEYSIICAQLTTERTNCGYIIIALPKYSIETTTKSRDLFDLIFNQINLIARLIEKNNLLYELQVKNLSKYAQPDSASN